MVWNNDCVKNPVLPLPQGYGRTMENDGWIPVMTTLSPAPEAITQLVKCRCAEERCSTNCCQCRRAGLLCTDLCSSSDDDHKCEIQQGEWDDYDGDIEDEEDEEDVKLDRR